jgi:hypothetical protein
VGLLESIIQMSPLAGDVGAAAIGSTLIPAVAVLDWKVCFMPAANVFPAPVSANVPVGAANEVPQADPVETGIPAPGYVMPPPPVEHVKSPFK